MKSFRLPVLVNFPIHRRLLERAVAEPLPRFIADCNPKGDQDYIVVYDGPVKAVQF